MEVDDPGISIAPVGMISCTQTEEQAVAGSNVSIRLIFAVRMS